MVLLLLYYRIGGCF